MVHLSYIFNTYTPCGVRVYGKWAEVVEESTKIDDVTCQKCLEVK